MNVRKSSFLVASALAAACTVQTVPPPEGPPAPPPQPPAQPAPAPTAAAPPPAPAPAPAPPPPVAAAPAPSPPPSPAWDPTGWTFLGDRTVQGGHDVDVIQVGKRTGKFSRITMVVEGSDLELFDLEVHFGNGEKFSPQLRHVFREGSRSRAIDLPGEARFIKRVKFRYGNLPGGGRAKVALWARETPVAAQPPSPPPAPPPPAPPAPRPAAFDPTGWTLLGDQRVDGKKDRDVIHVGKKEGQFTKMVLVVEDSDVDLFDVEVTFGNGEKFSPQTRMTFREGSRSRVIDLPGSARFIKKVAFRYGNLAGGGRARIVLYARAEVAATPPVPPPPPPAAAPAFDPTGWTLLGEKQVHGKRDQDVLHVGKKEGQFTKVVIVVEGSDLEMFDLEITFGNGQTFAPKTRLVFREGSRSQAIDLPGNTRYIKQIAFRYGNLPGGGRARVLVYAR